MTDNAKNAKDELFQPYSTDEVILKIKRNKKWSHLSVGTHIKLVLSDRAKERLRSAASLNDVATVCDLLETGKTTANCPDNSGRTPLHLAASRGFTDIVKILLKHGANCSALDNRGNTPLHLAVCTSSMATIKVLLEAGSMVSISTPKCYSPLRLAQSKLSLLRSHTSPDYDGLKAELAEVIAMMEQQAEKEKVTDLAKSFDSQLNLSQKTWVEEAMAEYHQFLTSVGETKSSKETC